MRATGLIRPLLYGLGFVAASLALAELGCRVTGAADPREPSAVSRTPTEGRIALIDILRSHPNPSVVYELKPGLENVVFRDAKLRTNELGARGGPISRDEPEDTITIVGLGDSSMFGWGVDEGSSFLSILERRLREKYSAKRWRVINLAVPAYNTVMEVESFASKALPFAPDLVIVSLSSNDLGLPEYLPTDAPPTTRSRSCLIEYLRDRFGSAPSKGGTPSGRDPGLRYVTDEDRSNADRGPHRRLSGWAPFLRALKRLAELAELHRFEVVTVSTIEDADSPRLARSATDLGFSHVRVFPRIQGHLAERGHPNGFSIADPAAYLNSDLVLSPGDGHPSPLQHSMIAAELFEACERNETWQRLMR